jgi:hypothetical protein
MGYTGGGNRTHGKSRNMPSRFVDAVTKSVVNAETHIDRLEGMFRMSQELVNDNRKSIVEGFEALGADDARKMAETVERRGAKKDAKGNQPMNMSKVERAKSHGGLVRFYYSK